tara:strand:+ start:451 stop:642 length:192 start_codon:yes stop_codon:yes gene_type:complete
MAKIKIDEKEYETDDLSDNAKANLISLQFVRGEINRLDAQLAVYKTAEISYAKAVKDSLGSDS